MNRFKLKHTCQSLPGSSRSTKSRKLRKWKSDWRKTLLQNVVRITNNCTNNNTTDKASTIRDDDSDCNHRSTTEGDRSTENKSNQIMDIPNGLTVVQYNDFSPITNSSLTSDQGIFDNIDYDKSSDDEQGGSRFNSAENYSSDSDSDSEIAKTHDQFQNFRSIKLFLTEWALKHNITHSALNDLLNGLKNHGFQLLPRDARTLLRTPKKISTKVVEPGNYCHFGIESNLKAKLNGLNSLKFTGNKILIDINIDGVPIFRSTNLNCWPILGIAPQIDDLPFIIGLYSGTAKPKCVNGFLESFFEDYNNLKLTNLTYKELEFIVAIRNVICDTPAKAFVCNTKGDSGYSSCSKCKTEGKYFKNKMIFPELNAPLRTDLDFENKTDDEFHRGSTILESTGIGMTTQIPLDHMHVVLLGIVNRLIYLWLEGPLGVRLNSAKVNEISNKLLALKLFSPSEFTRKPRSLNEYRRWKATEFRHFLLYTGPVVLKNIISQAAYEHFMSSHVAIRILCSHAFCTSLNSYAKALLKYFIEQMEEIYGVEEISYNVHSLIHLNNDVLRNGPLDTFSAFPFENFLREMKKMIRKPDVVLTQIHHRVMEMNKFLMNSQNMNRKNEPNLRFFNRVKNTENKFFSCTMRRTNTTLSGKNQKDSYVMLNDKSVIRIKYFQSNSKCTIVYCHKVTNYGNLYEKPANCSKILGQLIGSENVTDNSSCEIDIKNIKWKMCAFPINTDRDDNLVAYIPMLHNFELES